METQVKALTILLSALRGRFVCGNSAFSRQISTFYGPSVQNMETRLGARQRRRPPTVHRGSTHAPRLQRSVASEDEASACSELRRGCHPETPVIEPCPISGGQSLGKPLPDLSRHGQSLCEGPFSVSCRKSKPFKPSDAVGFDEKSLEERDLELTFERGDPLAHGRLRAPQLHGCGGETPQLRGPGEGSQVRQFGKSRAGGGYGHTDSGGGHA